MVSRIPLTPAFLAAAWEWTLSATSSAGPVASALVLAGLAGLAAGAVGSWARSTSSPPTVIAVPLLVAGIFAVAFPASGHAALLSRARVLPEAEAALSFGALDAPGLSLPTLSIFALGRFSSCFRAVAVWAWAAKSYPEGITTCGRTERETMRAPRPSQRRMTAPGKRLRKGGEDTVTLRVRWWAGNAPASAPRALLLARARQDARATEGLEKCETARAPASAAPGPELVGVLAQ